MNMDKLPTESCETIQSVHSDIVLPQLADFESYLSTIKTQQVIFEDASRSLKHPLSKIELRYAETSPEDFNFHASVLFPASQTKNLREERWQTISSKYIGELLESRDVKIHILDHQTDDLYAVIDDENAAWIHFESGTSLCAVSVSLEKLNEIDFVNRDSGEEVGDTEPNIPKTLDRYETMKAICEFWSVAIDSTVDQFGKDSVFDNSKQKIEIVVSSPDQESGSKELVLAKGAVEEFISGVSIPEKEKISSKNEGFELIGGLTHAIARLREIAAVYQNPEGAEMYGISGRHFVLHGPAGTGKTSLVRAFAHEIGAEINFVDSTDLVDKYIGNSGKLTKQLFDEAKKQENLTVIFFDEFDALARKNSHESTERVDVKKLLNQMIDDVSKNHPNIIIAAATNADVLDLESSLVRSGRIEAIGAPAPNDKERIDVWAAVLHRSWLGFQKNHEIVFDSHGNEYIETFTPYDNDINPVELAESTNEMTGADFEIILERARRKCFLHYQKTGEALKVSQVDLLREIKNFGL